MKRQTVLIGAAAAVAVLVAWYLLLWSPRQADLSEASDRREAAEAQRAELATRVGRLRASQKEEPMKRAQVEALRTTVPDEPNLAAFILDTNDAAAKAGIDFISVAPAEPAPAAPPVAVPAGTAAPAAAPGTPPAEIKLQLQVSGGYFQVLDFLNRLNDLPRLVVTDTLAITSDEQAKLTVGVAARMFVRTVPPGYGAVPATAAPVPAAATSPAPAPATPAATPTPTGARP